MMPILMEMKIFENGHACRNGSRLGFFFCFFSRPRIRNPCCIFINDVVICRQIQAKEEQIKSKEKEVALLKQLCLYGPYSSDL